MRRLPKFMRWIGQVLATSVALAILLSTELTSSPVVAQQTDPFMTLQARFHELKNSGKLDEALQLAPELESRVAGRFGANSVQLAGILLTTGDVFRMHGEYDKADERVTRAIQIFRLPPTDNTASADRRKWLALALLNFAVLRDSQGRTGEAEPIIREAVELFKATNSGGSELTRANAMLSAALKKQADTAYSEGRFTDSEQLYTKALKSLQETSGPDDIPTAIMLRLIGDTYQAQGRYIEAEATYKRAERIFEKNSAEQSAYTILNLTGLYMQQCRLTEAAESLARTVDIVEGADWHVVNAGFASALGSQLVTLGLIYYVGRRSEAESKPLIARTAAILKKVGGDAATATALPLRIQCESEGHLNRIEEFVKRDIFLPPRK